jgi:hypothetical protein
MIRRSRTVARAFGRDPRWMGDQAVAVRPSGGAPMLDPGADRHSRRAGRTATDVLFREGDHVDFVIVLEGEVAVVEGSAAMSAPSTCMDRAASSPGSTC